LKESKIKLAVLGSGNGGRAFAAQFAAKENFSVAMYEPLAETEDFRRLRQTGEMFLKGDVECGGRIAVTMDMGEAVGDADAVFVVVPSFAHEPIFAKLIPYLRDGQHVFVVPGNYASFLLRKMMKEAGCAAKISISETASLPYACRIVAFDTVNIYKKKFRMKLGTWPLENNGSALEIINSVFSGVVDFFPAAGGVLEIDLDNINYTLHPMPILFNYGDIERNPGTFRHYMDGITPLVSEKMMRMDEERLAAGAALGLDLMSTMEQLKMYYGANSAATIYEYVNSPESPYEDIVGHSVKSRYLTEDVPFCMVPGMLMGRIAGLSMPIVSLVIETASFLHDTEYLAKGHTMRHLGLEGMTPRRITEYSKAAG